MSSETPQTYPRTDLVGCKFGRLQVLEFVGRKKKLSSKYGVAFWRCKCDCGTVTSVCDYNLKVGAARSCGCAIVDSPHRIVHGKYGTAEYRVYQGMLTRCFNHKDIAYRNYGARGISVNSVWLGPTGFSNFMHDMGVRPSSDHSLERIRVNEWYGPDNCRWATRLEQANNKRNTIRVIYTNGEASLKDACRDLGIQYCTVRNRMIQGMTFQEAVARPVRGRNTISIKQRCRDAGMPYVTVFARLQRGWSIERALVEPIKGHAA